MANTFDTLLVTGCVALLALTNLYHPSNDLSDEFPPRGPSTLEAYGEALRGDAVEGNETLMEKVAFVIKWIARESGWFGEVVDTEGTDEPDPETFEQTAYKIQIAIDTLYQRIESHGEPSAEYRNQISVLTDQRRKLNQIIQKMNSVAQGKGKTPSNNKPE